MDSYDEPTSLNLRLRWWSAAAIIGGALVFIGIFMPWTRESLSGPGVTVVRNGFQLGGTRGGFSVVGLLVGARSALDGALRLAERRPFRVIGGGAILDGIAAVAVGLFAVGNARWYVGQMLAGSSHLFVASVGYGVWLVLIGGGVIFVADLTVGGPVTGVSGWKRTSAAVIVTAAVGVAAWAIAAR